MAKETPKEESGCCCDWEHETAYKLVDLYVKELIERKNMKGLNLEGLVEAYLYVLGRLKGSEHEMDELVRTAKGEIRIRPDTNGIKEALGDKKVNAGLLKALEKM